MNPTLQTINAFRQLIRDAPGEVQACIDEKKLCEEAFHDIYHFAEMYPRSRANQRKITNQLKIWTERRRSAKNRIKELQAIAAFAEENKFVLGKLDTVVGKLKKEVEYLEGNKFYKPRVVKELFENK